MQEEYKNIEKLYNSSLGKKEIDADLKIKIKNYLENTRSILDYCAHDIADTLGISGDRIYFPIIEKDKSKDSFSGAIGRNLSGLELKNAALFNYLENIQSYHPEYSWLGDFNDIVNDNKHQDLTPQTKTESHRIKSEHAGGGSVSWNPSAVRFEADVFINGAPVDPTTQMPIQTSATVVTKEIWVDFKFNNTVSALPLLKKINNEVSKIVESIYKLI
ncbi:MAG: hypothetical protein Q8L47_00340 [bacterium]|nr:hypothetical protein [bacterium]